MTEIEKLFEAATEGPWQAVIADPHEAPGPIYAGIVCLIEAGENGISVLAESGFVPKEDWAANAAFIAAARTAVPELLAALKGAEGERRAAIEAERVRLLAIMYCKLPGNTAKLCDEELDRSGRLLGLVREAARAALASNSGGGDVQSQEKAS